MVERGQFREDLYYRLNVINLRVPPLRDRIDDLPMLVEHFLQRFNKDGQRARRMSPETMARLYAHNWPGNIRELENEIERLVVLSGEREDLGPDLLSPGIGADRVAPSFDEVRKQGTLEVAVAVE